MRRALGFFAALSLLAPLSLSGAESTLASANVAARWLDLPGSARLSAMGGAFTAVADDVNSLSINPAGLANLGDAQASFTHNLWVEGATQDHLGAALPLGALGGVAVGVDYVNFGAVERFSVDSLGAPQSQGSYNPYGANLSLGWGLELGGGLAAGVALKSVMQDLNQDLASAYAVDMGLLWQSPLSGLSLAASLQNFGTQLQGSDLPLKLRGGVAYALAPAGLPLRLAADLVAAPHDAVAPQVMAGLELQPVSHLWVRAGYQVGDDDNPSGPSVGLGLSGLGPLTLDYAFNDVGSLGATQQVSLQMSLASFFSPAAAPAASAAPPAPVSVVAAPLAVTAPAALDADVKDFVSQLKGQNYANAGQEAAALQVAAPEKAQAVLEQARSEVVTPAVFEGRTDDAIQVLSTMQKLDPKDSYVEEAWGMMEWQDHHYEEARQHFKKAWEMDPSLEFLKRY